MPVVRRLSAEPLTLHTDGVSVANETARPEDAVALNDNGPVPRICLGIGGNAIVWLADVTACESVALVELLFAASPE